MLLSMQIHTTIVSNVCDVSVQESNTYNTRMVPAALTQLPTEQLIFSLSPTNFKLLKKRAFSTMLANYMLFELYPVKIPQIARSVIVDISFKKFVLKCIEITCYFVFSTRRSPERRNIACYSDS